MSTGNIVLVLIIFVLAMSPLPDIFAIRRMEKKGVIDGEYREVSEKEEKNEDACKE